MIKELLYLGDECPNCHSFQAEINRGELFRFHQRMFRRKSECASCKATWIEHFALLGFDELETKG